MSRLRNPEPDCQLVKIKHQFDSLMTSDIKFVFSFESKVFDSNLSTF